MVVVLIVATEIAFWVVLAAGLVARYVLGRRRLGAILLAGVPLVDLVLLTATVIDLRGGATAEVGHGLAAAYIGFSVAFGHRVIRWADQRFAHRFAGGPPPVKPPRHGRARARHEWRLFRQAFTAWAISVGLLATAIVLVADADRIAALEGWILRLTMVLAIWSLWPITYTLWPPRPKPREAH
jgi:hypothetical protein